MAVKLILYCIVTICVFNYVNGLDANCPLSSTMTSCSPKCKEDSECGGRKCCPNICNQKSCVPANHNKYANDDYKKNNQKTATGTYCGNTKCSSFEKCELDRSTKRMKCVPA